MAGELVVGRVPAEHLEPRPDHVGQQHLGGRVGVGVVAPGEAAEQVQEAPQLVLGEPETAGRAPAVGAGEDGLGPVLGRGPAPARTPPGRAPRPRRPPRRDRRPAAAVGPGRARPTRPPPGSPAARPAGGSAAGGRPRRAGSGRSVRGRGRRRGGAAPPAGRRQPPRRPSPSGCRRAAPAQLRTPTPSTAVPGVRALAGGCAPGPIPVGRAGARAAGCGSLCSPQSWMIGTSSGSLVRFSRARRFSSPVLCRSVSSASKIGRFGRPFGHGPAVAVRTARLLELRPRRRSGRRSGPPRRG